MNNNKTYLNHLTAALIIGGKSSRFGSLKQLAKIEDRRLIELAVDKSTQLSKDIIAITGSYKFDLPGYIVQYNDIYPGKGPLGGIHTALYYCKSIYCAVIPCDMPLLTPDIYRLLYQHVSPDHPVSAVSLSGKEPLVSIWPKKLLPEVTNAIQQNHLKLFQLLDELSARFIDFPSVMPSYKQDYFYNINTPEELQKIVEKIDGSGKHL